VKFVITDRCDFDWAHAIVNQYRLPQRVSAVLMSPVFGALPPADLASWILSERLPVRLQLQTHKHIWPPGTRGV
jgi:7-carboxy-7-deazaguanine synthase